MMSNYVFFTSSRLSELWDFVKILLKMTSPAVMISVAILAVGLLLPLVVKAFKKSEENQYDGAYDLHDDDDEYVRRTR